MVKYILILTLLVVISSQISSQIFHPRIRTDEKWARQVLSERAEADRDAHKIKQLVAMLKQRGR